MGRSKVFWALWRDQDCAARLEPFSLGTKEIHALSPNPNLLHLLLTNSRLFPSGGPFHWNDREHYLLPVTCRLSETSSYCRTPSWIHHKETAPPLDKDRPLEGWPPFLSPQSLPFHIILKYQRFIWHMNTGLAHNRCLVTWHKDTAVVHGERRKSELQSSFIWKQ